LDEYLAKALFAGGCIIGVSIFLSGLYCGFDFGAESCPTPDVEILLGAALGALTTALFFMLIDRPVKLTLERVGKLPHNKDRIVVWLAVFGAMIIATAITLPILYCSLQIRNGLCLTPDASVWLGAFMGVLTTALFFFLINRRFKPTLQKLGELYVARTCILNLMDIFGQSKDKGRIKKSEYNRTYFLDILKNDYIKLHRIEGTLVNQIHDLARSHEEIVEDHDHTACQKCKDIMAMIRKFNAEQVNTIQENAQNLDWINRV
jgi:hypothetical protein